MSTNSRARKMFGRHLLEKGLVTYEQLVWAIDRQISVQTPLVKLAAANRMLRETATIAALQQEVRAPDQVLGTLAVETGLLREEELGQLIELQRSTRPPLGEVLVDMGVLSADELARELAAFVAD